MSKYKHKALKEYLCVNIHTGNETIFMTKYKHKAMKQHLSLNINARQ